MFVYRLLRFFCFLLCKLFFHLKVRDREFIPKNGGFILVSNHASFLDPIILGVVSRRILNFAARDSLFRNRLFAWLLREVGAFPIKRWSADLTAVKESITRLKKRFGLVVFPEGTRSASGHIQEITHGFVLLAYKAGVPIVPVRIFGSHKAWARTKKIFRPAKIRVVIGKPVYVGKSRDYRNTAQQVFRQIQLLKISS